jgi:primosomal protein N' (replication factor Y)
MRCHYCGFETPVIPVCRSCTSMAVSQKGLGTQQVEEKLQALFPEAIIGRLDGDVRRKRHEARSILEAFQSGEMDILIGTQMIAKGLDIPNVTLVGVLQADTSFNLPDYKAVERGFQLLTQVAGRAGRGEKPGKVLIQTYQPEHPVIQLAMAQDYPAFYGHELPQRQQYYFPPYCDLVRFIISGEDEAQTKHFAKAASLFLQQDIDAKGMGQQMLIQGPVPCLIAKIQDRYRFHFIVKCPPGEQSCRLLLTAFYQQVTVPPKLRFILDIYPQSLM